MSGTAEKKSRFISKPEVLDRVGVTYVTIWEWMRASTFPRSRQVGGKACWLESEIDDWIFNRPVRRLKGDPQDQSQQLKPARTPKPRTSKVA